MRELPVLQGFPVFKYLSYGRPCCSFAVGDKALGDWPARSALCRMCGNSMHINVCGIVMLFVWSQIEMDLDLFKMIRMTSAVHHRTRTVIKHIIRCDSEPVASITSFSGTPSAS